ncbi:hypothetical protein [Streptomyces aidingensis]|uniref:Uncharacterized protein n=1 Tax=Streptomyces aidingensis TaxID=910347 RepID=A0A1I1S127_9ACTN|nr:hypothetical protein [Streptomyces aidingensis]SFD40241.1 hypothetical protein SAMN05421773_114133 [Streptomyces aidingensis]
MISHLFTVFRGLFTTRASRAAVALLIMVTAAVPVAEMAVLRMFSSLILEGPETFAENKNELILPVCLFFLAFAVTRGAHHLVRLLRVRVFRKGFETSGRNSKPSQESWEWALAFELSAVLVSLVQAVMFSALFFLIDWPTAILNVVASAAVLYGVSVLYRRELSRQQEYIKVGTRPGSPAIAQRVGGRIRNAEFGSILASTVMVVVLAFMLYRALTGEIPSSDAIIMFLALRLLSGQLGTLSAGITRFARATARTGARSWEPTGKAEVTS